MENKLQEIGRRIRQARQARGLSQAQLAEMLNVSPPYISNLENGKQAMTVTVLLGMAEGMGVSADWLLHTDAALHSAQGEWDRLLEDCSLSECRAILHIAAQAKAAIRAMQSRKEAGDE